MYKLILMLWKLCAWFWYGACRLVAAFGAATLVALIVTYVAVIFTNPSGMGSTPKSITLLCVALLATVSWVSVMSHREVVHEHLAAVTVVVLIGSAIRQTARYYPAAEFGSILLWSTGLGLLLVAIPWVVIVLGRTIVRERRASREANRLDSPTLNLVGIALLFSLVLRFVVNDVVDVFVAQVTIDYFVAMAASAGLVLGVGALNMWTPKLVFAPLDSTSSGDRKELAEQP